MRFTCSGPAFYTWRLLPLICLKLLAGVCASYETGLLPLFAYVTLLLLLPLSYFLGVGAPSLSLDEFMFYLSFLRGSLFVVASEACVSASLALFLRVRMRILASQF